MQVDDTPFSSGNNLAVIDLIDAIENDRKPISAAEDAVAALEMILGAYESQLTGKRDFIPYCQSRASVEKIAVSMIENSP